MGKHTVKFRFDSQHDRDYGLINDVFDTFYGRDNESVAIRSIKQQLMLDQLAGVPVFGRLLKAAKRNDKEYMELVLKAYSQRSEPTFEQVITKMGINNGYNIRPHQRNVLNKQVRLKRQCAFDFHPMQWTLSEAQIDKLRGWGYKVDELAYSKTGRPKANNFTPTKLWYGKGGEVAEFAHISLLSSYHSTKHGNVFEVRGIANFEIGDTFYNDCVNKVQVKKILHYDKSVKSIRLSGEYCGIVPEPTLAKVGTIMFHESEIETGDLQ